MRTSYDLVNIPIEIDGTAAAAQSYFTAWHQFEFEGRTWDWIIAGRYLDRFECRHGQWRIVHRNVVYDLERFDGPGEIPAGHPRRNSSTASSAASGHEPTIPIG
jgi:hypothetical protein